MKTARGPSGSEEVQIDDLDSGEREVCTFEEFLEANWQWMTRGDLETLERGDVLLIGGGAVPRVAVRMSR